MPNTIRLYNVKAGAELDYEVVLDGHGDFVATEPISGDFLKFPGDADLASLAVTHNEHNAGQVPVDGSGTPVMSQAQQDLIDAAAQATGVVQNVEEPVPSEPAQEPQPEQPAPSPEQPSQDPAPVDPQQSDQVDFS